MGHMGVFTPKEAANAIYTSGLLSPLRATVKYLPIRPDSLFLALVCHFKISHVAAATECVFSF